MWEASKMAIQSKIKKRDWTVHPKASSTQPLIPLKHTLSDGAGLRAQCRQEDRSGLDEERR